MTGQYFGFPTGTMSFMKVDVYYNQRLDRFSVLERATRRVWGYFEEIWLCDVRFIQTSRRPLLRAEAFYPTVEGLRRIESRPGWNHLEVTPSNTGRGHLVRCMLVNNKPKYYSFLW